MKWKLPVLAGAGAISIFAAFQTIESDLLHGSHTPEADAANPAQVATGAVLYARHCASCHGEKLEGQPGWKTKLSDGRFPAPPHDETGHTWHHSDALLFRVTKNGGKPTARGWTSGMPAFGDALTDSEIWAILAFIKSRWPQETQALQARQNR